MSARPRIRRCVFSGEALTGRITTGTRRNFSQCLTRRAHGGLPEFHQSTSTELDELLASMRSKIFIPSRLNREQQKLIRSPRNEQLLLNEVITANVGGEEVRLEPVLLHRDGLSKTAFKDAVKLAREPRDVENLAMALEEFQQTNSPLKQAYLEMFIKKSMKLNAFYVVWECLQKVGRTGMSLAHWGIRERVFQGLYFMAYESEWEEESTKKALRYSEQVLELMERPGHCGELRLSWADPRSDPAVVSLPLGLAGVLALRYGLGQEMIPKISLYANRTMTCIEGRGIEAVLNPLEKQQLKGNVRKVVSFWEPIYSAYRSIMIWNALRLSQKVLGKTMPFPEMATEAVETLEQNVVDRLQAWKQGSYPDNEAYKELENFWEGIQSLHK